MKQLFSSTLVAVMVIACCYGSVSALEAPDMRASLTLIPPRGNNLPQGIPRAAFLTLKIVADLLL